MGDVAEPRSPALGGRSRAERRRGLSLVLVISVMLILIVVATGFAAFTSQDMRTSQAVYEQNETYFLAEAGIDYGLFLLKHSMLVFPNPPSAWADGRAQALYNADNNTATNTGGGVGLDLRGSLINAAQSFGGNSYPGQEYVVISDLGYVPANNWMGGVRTCGTFLLKQSVAGAAGGNYTITFTSTGYIKQIPAGTTVTSTDAGGNPTGFSTVGASTWSVVAQRTLQAVVNVSNPSYPVTGPTAITSVQVKTFNERFR